jgi:hypothetical protein
MITGISIENFKGVRERVEIDLRQLTLLFGPNSAGKSSIIHALHYAVEVFERGNLNAHHTSIGADAIDLGGFSHFIHAGNKSSTIWLGFTLGNERDVWFAFDRDPPMDSVNGHFSTLLDNVDAWVASFINCHEASVEVGIRWSEQLTAPYLSTYRVKLNGQLFAELVHEPTSQRVYISRLDLANPALVTFRQYDSRPDEAKEDVGLEEVFDVNPDESVLSACLWDCQEFFEYIEGDSTHGPPGQHAPLLLKNSKLLPHSGDEFELAMRELRHVESPDAKASREERQEQIALFALAQEVAFSISDTLTTPLRMIREALREFRYVGPLRRLPERSFAPQNRQSGHFLSERSRWPSGLGAWDLLHECPQVLIDRVNEWLTNDEMLGLGYSLHVKRYRELDLSDPLVVRLITGRYFTDDDDQRIDLSRFKLASRLIVIPKGSDLELHPQDLGVGVSQVVPVVVTALLNKEGLVAIEQPELHLHPRLQAALGDLFIEGTKNERRRLLLETHSEHLILRIQRRIRESTAGEVRNQAPIASDDVVVYYVGQTDGRTVVRRIDLDAKGDFVQPWPDDFFEIDFFERFG